MDDSFSISEMEQRKRAFRESLYKDLEDRLIGSNSEGSAAGQETDRNSTRSVPEKKGNGDGIRHDDPETNIIKYQSQQSPSLVSQPAFEEDKGADYRRLMAAIIDRKNMILTITFGLFLTTLFFTLIETPLYQANTKILRKQSQAQMMTSERKGPLEEYTIETVKDIMKTVPVLEKVIDDLKLDMSISDLSSKISLNLTKNSDVVGVSVTDRDKKRAVSIANTFSNAFIQNEIQIKQNQALKNFNYLEGQLSIVGKQLSDAEQALKNFKKDFGLVQLKTDMNLALDRLANFDTTYRLALVESKALDEKIEKLKKEYDGQDAEVILRSTYKQPLQNRLINLEAELAQALTLYTDENPNVVKIKDQIVTTKELIKKNIDEQASELTYGENTVKKSFFEKLILLQTEKLANDSKVTALKSIRDSIEEKLERLPEKELKYLDLERKKMLAENSYNFLVKKMEEARLAKELTQGGFEVIELSYDAAKVSPNIKMNCILGLMTGLIIALIAALGLEYTENRVKTPREVKEFLGLPTLGTIPLVEEEGKLLNPDPQLSIGGTFGYLADSLRNAGLNETHRSLLVVSAEQGEGKSFVSDNLALVRALEGDRVAIVDANLRNTSQTSGIKPKGYMGRIPGLWDYLEGRAGAKDILLETSMENLHIILPGEPGNTNPLKLLKAERMSRLIKHLESRYNLFVLSTAETSNYSDAALLSSMVDGILLVVEYGKVNADKLKRVASRVDNPYSNILGVIINKKKCYKLLGA